jgi:3-hydroxybutyryl-CoA dehydratase|tara:strand:+ start:163 stop:588 length:426 start_codon:yes stop_codon:yes gene_type:complete
MIENVAGITADTVVTFTKEVTQQDINTFADVTGDHNPLHSNEEYAAQTRFKQPIAHGMFGAGVISAALGTRLAPESVVVYLGQNLRFRAPVLAGDTITATCTVTTVEVEKSRLSLQTTVTNQDGLEVIIGDAQVMIDEIRS